MKITLQLVKRVLNEMGLHFKKTTAHGREYRVCPQGASEAHAYYTNDLTDALLTGRDMAERIWGVRHPFFE